LIHVRWAEFAIAAPEMAALGRELLEARRVVLIATVRRDGSPRISCAEPVALEGDLYLGMMLRSRKAVDLRRDPRLVIHNPICSNAGDEVEFSLKGQAIEVHDVEVRRRFVEAVAEMTTWKEPHFHLFAIDIDSAALIKYERGEQLVKVWPGGRERRQRYG
jgi:pyridoxamine 5'-phosphate oxidase-like protein